jgi:hypothetical protein
MPTKVGISVSKQTPTYQSVGETQIPAFAGMTISVLIPPKIQSALAESVQHGILENADDTVDVLARMRRGNRAAQQA